MNFLDRAISYVAPGMALQRQLARTALNSVNGGVPNRLSEAWQQAQGFRFGAQDEQNSTTNARGRAQQAYDRNPVAQSLADIETDNVIGDGLNYQPTTDDEAWNDEAKDRYYYWLEDCSVLGPDVETGCELQRSLWTDSRVQGDGGLILVARGTPDRLESRLQAVAAENIVTPDGMWSDKSIRDGIRYDAFGRPLAFYLLSNDETTGRRTFTEVPARDFVYLPHRTKRNQGRPPSCYVTVYDRLSQLDRYIDGVSLAAWMATVFGLIFRKSNPGKELAGLGTYTNSQGDAQKAVTFENGMVKYIGTDEEVAQVQAHQPMSQTEMFMRALLRSIGQPFGMPLEVVALDMSTANFASARIGLLPFYRKCRIKAYRFGSRWSRVIRWWLSREAQRSDGDPKKWRTPFPADYWKHELVCNEWDYTDPVSEAQSDLLQIDMGTKSPQMVITERGRDVARILAERREWMELTKDLPMVNSGMTRHPQSGVGATGDPLGKEAVEPPKPAAPQQQTKDDEDGDA